MNAQSTFAAPDTTLVLVPAMCCNGPLCRHGKAPGYLSLPESHERLQGHSRSVPSLAPLCLQ